MDRKQANDWYAKQPFLVGSNYVPASAINELECGKPILSIRSALIWNSAGRKVWGMNTMRVFLHDLAYSQDPEGLKKRLDQFLAISARHKIKPQIVFFDSVWDPNPQIGKQRLPRPGIHNSGWVQSPGAKALANPSEYPRLEKYVKDININFIFDVFFETRIFRRISQRFRARRLHPAGIVNARTRQALFPNRGFGPKPNRKTICGLILCLAEMARN
jgi:hypothetical protein